MTHANSFITMAALEIPVTLTPTVGVTLDTNATAATHTLSSVTAGSIVAVWAGNANTTNGTSLTLLDPKGVGVGSNGSGTPVIGPLVACEATGTSVSVVSNASTNIQMVELT